LVLVTALLLATVVIVVANYIVALLAPIRYPEFADFWTIFWNYAFLSSCGLRMEDFGLDCRFTRLWSWLVWARSKIA